MLCGFSNFSICGLPGTPKVSRYSPQAEDKEIEKGLSAHSKNLTGTVESGSRATILLLDINQVLSFYNWI